MEEISIRLLLLEDDEVDRLAFERFVKNERIPYDYRCTGSVAIAQDLLRTDSFDAVIMDYQLSDGTAFDVFGSVPGDVPIIIVTGAGDEKIAVEAIKAGASHYVVKDPDGHYLKAIPITIHNSIKAKRAEMALQRYHDELEKRVEERTAEITAVNNQILREITERKKAEEKYRSIFENALEGIYQSTPEGRFISVNPAMARSLGYDSPEDLIESVTDIAQQLYVDPRDRVELLTLLRTQGNIAGFETQMRRKDGTPIWITLHVRPIRDEEGRFVLLEGILKDVTEEKLAQEALQVSEERYRSLVENIDIGVSLIDSNQTIVMTNAAQAAMAQKSVLDLIGGQCFRELLGRNKECDDCPGRRAMKEYRPAEREIEGIRPDGKHYCLRSRAFPTFDRGGAVTGHIEVVEDITDRKQWQEQVHQAAKMEAIGLLAGGVAHDFNNLLTAMIGYSTMLQSQMGKDEPQRAKVVQITRAAERAAALTRQLLALSRKQVLDTRLVGLNEIIVDFEAMLRRIIAPHIEIRTSLNESLGGVKADPSQIEQILLNLSVNARDAMPHGGKLIIETANVVLDEDYARTHTEVTPGPHVMMSLSDTGCGMDARTKSRVFEPFFTAKEKGTGLGLSTVYGIVKQHHGHITVYSELNRGTVFKVYLPMVKDAAAKPVEDVESIRLRRGSETVLVVDDEEIVQTLASEALELMGYTVLKATLAEEALAASSAHPGTIHLLLTDVVLPQIDGPSLFRRLFKQRPNMKVLYMSGYVANSIADYGVLDAEAHFLHKPFTINSLAAKVREVLDGGG